MYLMLIVSDHS